MQGRVACEYEKCPWFFNDTWTHDRSPWTRFQARFDDDALENSTRYPVVYSRPLNAKQRTSRASGREARSLINHV